MAEEPSLVDAAARAVHRPLTLSGLMNFNTTMQIVDGEFAWNLAEMVKLVQRRGGTATITMKVSVVREEHGQVMIYVDQSTKPPANAQARAMAYVGDGGSLHRDDPWQGSLDFVTEADAALHTDQPLTDHEGKALTTDASGIVARPGEMDPLPATPGADPDAPYGRDADGTPYEQF